MTNLTEITKGSPKQIAWARSIRAEALEIINAQVAKVGQSFNEQQQAAVDKFFAIDDATFWIDSRVYISGQPARVVFGLIVAAAK